MALAGPNMGDLTVASPGIPHRTLTAGSAARGNGTRSCIYGALCSLLLENTVSGVQHMTQADRDLNPRPAAYTSHSTSQASGSL